MLRRRLWLLILFLLALLRRRRRRKSLCQIEEPQADKDGGKADRNVDGASNAPTSAAKGHQILAQETDRTPVQTTHNQQKNGGGI